MIVADPQPVLMLTSYRGRPLISVPALRAKVLAGQVGYFLLGRRCAPGAPLTAACVPTARWVIAHGVDVTRVAGLPHPGLLYRVDVCALTKGAAPVPGRARGRTATPRATRSRPPPTRARPARCARPRRA